MEDDWEGMGRGWRIVKGEEERIGRRREGKRRDEERKEEEKIDQKKGKRKRRKMDGKIDWDMRKEGRE